MLDAFLEGQSPQLWTMSQDANQFERFRNLLSGRLVNSLNPEQINQQTTQASLAQAQFKACIEVIHDGSDIRKPYARKLPNLTKVRSLEGNLVNGFNSFNSLMITDIDKRLHLLESTSYSTADDHYGVLAGVSISAHDIQRNQIQRVDSALKERFPGLPIRHLLDRGHDDADLFGFIGGEVQSRFVIRAKLNRNYPPDPSQKLHQAVLKGHSQTDLDKFIWRGNVYQQARMILDWGPIELAGVGYWVVRCQLYKRTGESIFKEPMVLITNELMASHGEAFGIYQAYLRRSRIETVFKFLKEQLGWETFRVRDFYVIQNVLALCYWSCGYFYEQRAELSQDNAVLWLCRLAKSKGKMTLHFLLKGLVIVANHLLFEAFVEEAGLTQEDVQQLIDYVK